MAIAAAATKTSLAASYAALATHGALATTAPGATAGTEPTGGSPAYARKALTWVPGAAGVTTATVTFDVPACTVKGTQLFTALTGGTYVDGKVETDAVFVAQDTVQVTFTYTQV
jgi:hypothetical protein